MRNDGIKTRKVVKLLRLACRFAQRSGGIVKPDIRAIAVLCGCSINWVYDVQFGRHKPVKRKKPVWILVEDREPQ